MTTPRKQILGRDPAAILAAVQVFLTLLLSFGALDRIGLDSQAELMLLMVVVNGASGLYLAWGTTETALAAIVELFKAAVAFGAIYGLSLTTEQTGLVIAAVTALATAWHRTQTSPLRFGTFAYIDPADTMTPKAA